MHERTPTTITAADLSAWDDHANRLTFAAKFFALAVASSPCQCGGCSHCQELASLDLGIKTSARHAAERRDWLEGPKISTATPASRSQQLAADLARRGIVCEHQDPAINNAALEEERADDGQRPYDDEEDNESSRESRQPSGTPRFLTPKGRP